MSVNKGDAQSSTCYGSARCAVYNMHPKLWQKNRG